ncbi:hypothetical protein [Bdellovibrio sp. HCB-110]|uniref:hypothetical protein n=1 Tax=Bdellovibrio sp. HCB-110 TaxID=3391182 RepID=UPI0039B55CD0
MRSKELKIAGRKEEGVLVAGGAGFKVYAVSGLNGWALACGRKINFIEDGAPEAKTVAQFVSLRYQPTESQEEIRKSFNQLIEALNPRSRSLDFESAP